MEENNNSAAEPEPQTHINLWMYATKIRLPLRARLVYARLCKLRRPVTARKLSSWLYGLVNEEVCGTALKSLQVAGLATRSDGGWLAVLPGKKPDAFVLSSSGHPMYYTITLPAENPFPRLGNAVEMFCLYFKLRDADRRGLSLTVSVLAEDTGMTRKTVAVNLKRLEDRGLYVDGKTRPQPWANAILTPSTQDEVAPMKGKTTTKAAERRHPLNVLLDGTAREADIRSVIKQLLGRGVALDGIISDIEKAMQRSKARNFPGDGTPLALAYLSRVLQRHTRQEDYRAAKSIAAAEAAEQAEAAKLAIEREQQQKRDAVQRVSMRVDVRDRLTVKAAVRDLDIKAILAVEKALRDVQAPTFEDAQRVVAQHTGVIIPSPKAVAPPPAFPNDILSIKDSLRARCDRTELHLIDKAFEIFSDEQIAAAAARLRGLIRAVDVFDAVKAGATLQPAGDRR